jgi:hypothetical protein
MAPLTDSGRFPGICVGRGQQGVAEEERFELGVASSFTLLLLLLIALPAHSASVGLNSSGGTMSECLTEPALAYKHLILSHVRYYNFRSKGGSDGLFNTRRSPSAWEVSAAAQNSLCI